MRQPGLFTELEVHTLPKLPPPTLDVTTKHGEVGAFAVRACAVTKSGRLLANDPDSFDISLP
jgi:hypothetical protein